ncbi:MAG: hypothetical protein LWW94_03075 [Candidatus Desulfofervidaceae bacterium]|nr:hypothetical protein [Candidatus Desulfofervidaceae bacterium]
MKRKKIIGVLIGIIIFVVFGYKESLAQPEQFQYVSIEGIVLKVAKHELWLLNLGTNTQEKYLITDRTKIEPNPLFPIDMINSKKPSLKSILREGYRIGIKINPKNQTIIQILIKEIPQ